MSWNVQGSMRGDGVPVAPGMLDSEAVAAGIMKAEGAIPGLFQETGLQDPQGVVHSENQWRHHGYHAYPGVDAQAALAAAVRGGLLIALRADVFAAEEVPDIVDIVPGKAMALDVVTAGGTLTVINVHGPGSGGDSWASKASFWADVAMYAAAKSAGGTRAVLLGGDFNVWLESPWHPTTRRFQALWEQCGFHRAGPEREEDRRPTRAGHRLDSFLLNSPLVPWAARERPHLAPGRSPASLGSDHGPVVLDIPLAVAGKERVTRMAYSHAQGRLHAIRPDSPGVREAVAAVLQKACGDRRLQAWLSSDQDAATMGTSEVQAVFDLLYAFRDDVSRVTGVRMPSGVDPQYPYGQAETEASLDRVLSDQQALAWRAHQLWQRDAAAAGLHSQEATALLHHLRRVDPDLSPASVEDLRAALDHQLQQLETRVEELRDALKSNRRRSIKDYWRGRVSDLQLRWTAIRGAINVVNYAPSGLWSVRVRESEKVLLEASDVIGEVQRYWEALYAKRPVNLPAFERLVRAHIPKGVPEEWRSVKDYTMQDLKDAVRQAVADDKAPGSNRVTAALIAELPEPVQGLLVHAYRAILRGADVPESWHEAIIWLMPKGTATGNLDEYRPIALGQQDMRMLMTPLMRRFTAVLARKGLAADWQFGAMPGSTAAAPVFLAQRRLQRGLEENHVLAFDVSKAFDTAPHGALALLLCHMGVPEELIRLFHTLSCGSLVRIITAHGPTPSIRLHRGLRQGSAESAVLYLLLLEPLLRSLACKARGDARHAVPPLVQAYCDDLLLVAHFLPQFLEYAAAIARYLTDMGMSLNVGKCAYANTARIHSIMVYLNPGDTAAPWVCLRAKGTVPYLGLRLDPRGMATMKEKHVLRCEALLGWCKNTLGPASVPHEVMAAVVGGIVRYAAPYLSDTAEAVIKLNTAIKAAALQFEKLPKDLSNVAVRSGHGLRLADVQVICRDSVVATMAQLTHHRSTTVRDELRAMLRDMHVQYGVCGQFMVPSASFATHAGNTWVDRVLRAMGTLRVELLMPSSVYSCVHAHLPQVQWAGRKWMSQSYTFKGRDICILSGPRTDVTVQSLTDPANDLLHARLPCPAPGHWAVQLQECHADHLHLPHAGVGPHQLDHVWLTGLRDVFRPQLPGPLTHRLIHPVRRKKAGKRNRQSAAGDVYVVGGYREEGWDPANPGLSMPLVPLAALLFLLGDVFEGYQEQDDPASVPLLTPHAGGGISPPPLWVVHGQPAFSRACAGVHKCSEWAIVLLPPAGPIPDPDGYSVPEVVRMSNVPHGPHVAVTSLRDGGAVERASVVVYQPSCSATVWGAEYTTALDAIKLVCGCDLAWRPHAVYRPRVVLSPELTASSAVSLGKVLHSPHSDVAWLEPHRYCWVPVGTKVTSSDASPQGDDATNVAVASHGIPTWTGAIYGTVPEAEIIGAAAYLLHTPPSACTVHVVDASVIGAHLRRAQEALYRGIKGPTSHLVNQHALSWIVEGLRRLPRRVGGPHHWVVRQSSHLAAVPLEAPDSTAARAIAPPVHLVLPKEHAILLVPGDNGELEPRVPSMQALQQVREMEWRSLAARTRAHTPLAGACEAMPLGAVHHGPTHRNMLRARDGRLSTMQVMRRWRQKLTGMAIPAHPCIFCGGPEEDIGHMRLLSARDEEVAGLLCRRVEEFTAELPLTDRAVEFVAWREHGCRWTE